MQQWEYKILLVDFETTIGDAERKLNALAQEGWELHCVSVSDIGCNSQWYLKRPRQE